NFAAILRVGFADGADRAHAHAVKIGSRLGGIALKISVQSAIALGGRKLVSRAREMVHPNVNVSGSQESFEAGAKDAELLGSFRQVRRKRALLFFQPGDVRVTEHGHAIRRESEHLIDGVLEASCGLMRQSVN